MQPGNNFSRLFVFELNRNFRDCTTIILCLSKHYNFPYFKIFFEWRNNEITRISV